VGDASHRCSLELEEGDQHRNGKELTTETEGRLPAGVRGSVGIDELVRTLIRRRFFLLRAQVTEIAQRWCDAGPLALPFDPTKLRKFQYSKAIRAARIRFGRFTDPL